MANANAAAAASKKEAESSAPLTLSSPGEATPASVTPGTPIPVGPSGRLARIDN